MIADQCIASQSLIHQVSVSDFIGNGMGRKERVKSLNPLFIRSQFQILNPVGLTALTESKSQSLIHQVSVSDGEQTKCDKESCKGSQSLIHQVSVSDLNGKIVRLQN